MDRDNQAGRMLFTDFDASEKGRPEPASLPGGTSVFAAMPNISDLAATLDLDFEDDENEPAPSPSTEWDETGADSGNDGEPPSETPQPPEKTEPAAPSDDDDILRLVSLAESGTRTARETPTPIPAPDSPDAPSWSDFTRSLTQTPAENAAALFLRAAAHPASLPAAFAPDYPAAESDIPFEEETEEDRELDVLSFLPPSADDEADADGGDYADDEDDVYRPFEGDWRGHRLGVRPPRQRPYGGIKRLEQWYRPPKEDAAENAEEVEKIADWFEPPEHRRGQASRDTTRLVPRPGVEMPQEEEQRQTPAPEERDGTQTEFLDDFHPAYAEGNEDSTTTTTTSMDLFADVDLEKVWKEKLNRPSKKSGGAGSTRRVDVFENVDLDAAWEEKRRRPDSRLLAARKQRPAAEEPAASTVVMPSDALQDHATVILAAAGLSLPDAPDAPEPTARSTSRSTMRRKRKKPPPLDPGLTPGGDALGFLDDLDSFLSDDGEEEEPARSKKNRVGALPSTIEELEIDDLISDADGDKAEAGDPGPAPETGTEGETLAADDASTVELEELVAAAEEASPAETAEEQDYIPLGNVIGGDEYGSLEVVGADAPARTRPTTTDDVIDETSFGDEPDVDESIQAPVLDDSVIDTKVRNAGPDADELIAILEGGKTADVADAAENGAEAGEGEEGGETAESVAVDPMSVLSGLDDMDFSDDDMLDDELKAMLDEDAQDEAAMADGGGEAAAAPPPPEAVPATRWGKVKYFARKLLLRVVPGHMLDRVNMMIAWRENWWFYCDLLAAVIASASLAVIFSYYFWYRG